MVNWQPKIKLRQPLNIHKGNLLGNLTDFQSLSVDVIDRKHLKRQFYRDHGHKLNILNSLISGQGEDTRHIIATAKLFLAIRVALDTGLGLVLSHEEAMGLATK